jgi:hypothetical protein
MLINFISIAMLLSLSNALSTSLLAFYLNQRGLLRWPAWTLLTVSLGIDVAIFIFTLSFNLTYG